MFGATDCPINPLEFALLDPSITNLVNQAGLGADPLPLISSFAGTTATPLAVPAAALPAADIGPVALNNAADDGSPDFGDTTTFPVLTTANPSAASSTTSSTVPLPPAGFLLIFALLALRPVRAIKAVRRGVANVLPSVSLFPN